MLVDTHAHLYWDSYSRDYDQVLGRAKQAGVGLVINIGTDPETNIKVLQLSPQNSGIQFYSTVGLHPHEGAIFTSDQQIQDQMSQLESLYLANQDKIVGIGECGLDFFVRESQIVIPAQSRNPDGDSGSLVRPGMTGKQQQAQKQLFQAQIDLAKKLNLPLVIHCREAWNQIWEMDLAGTSGVFHNFTGSEADAQTALELGYYLSFSCILTYPKNQPLRDLVKNLPLSKIVSETDCPFLPPQPIRGQRNEPSYIPEVVKIISEVKSLDPREVEDQLYQNTLNLFKI